MTHDPYPHSNTDANEGALPRLRRAGNRRRWLTIAGIVVLVLLAALMIVLHLSGVVGPETN